MKIKPEFDNNYNKVVVRKEELSNGQTRVKEYNSNKEYDTWGMYLVSISQAIQELEAKKQSIQSLIEELKCLI
ncbi:MAG: hypothetical protein ACO3UU_12180 [Minisyncoccia bacterium]